MKKVILAFFAACCAIVAAGNGDKSARAKELKVLTIGNSFTLYVFSHFLIPPQ